MTYWVGLTGGIGSGKSAAAAAFAALGVPLIDADAISRALTAEGGAALPAIRGTFGDAVFDEAGRLNRAALRETVFRRPQQRQRLEALMFPLILAAIAEQQTKTQAVYGVIEIPQLIEHPQFWPLVQRVLVVDVDEALQIERVAQRSGLSETEIRRIMAAQATSRQRCRLADDVLSNRQTPAVLQAKVARLHRYYQALFSHLSRVSP